MPQFLRHAINSDKAFWNTTKKAFIDAMSLVFCLFPDIKRVTIKNKRIIASITLFVWTKLAFTECHKNRGITV